MKKNLALSAACLAALLLSPCRTLAFGFSMPSVPEVPSAGSGGPTEAELDACIQGAADAGKLVDSTAIAIFRAVATKEEIKAVEDQLASATAIKDPGEREAAVKKVNESVKAQLATKDLEKQSAQLATSLDAKKQEQLKGAVYNFLLGGLKDTEVVLRAKNLIAKGAPSPMLATRLVKVKDVVTDVGGQLANLGKISSGLTKMASAIKIDKLPTSATDAPKSGAID